MQCSGFHGEESSAMSQVQTAITLPSHLQIQILTIKALHKIGRYLGKKSHWQNTGSLVPGLVYKTVKLDLYIIIDIKIGHQEN